MSTVVLAMNEKDTLSVAVAVADLRDVILDKDPDLGVLNEWNRVRDRQTRKMLARLGYGYGRPLRGGGPVFWRKAKYRKRSVRSRMIARPGFMGKLPGRRSFLGASWLTVAQFDNLDSLGRVTGKRTALDGFHMTAEVQDVRGGGGYKTDPAHARRVARHQHERDRVEEIGGHQLDHDVDAYPAGDSNFARMELDGFENCWDGHPGGDLGGRPVTIVFAAEEPEDAPETVKTKSDHLAVVVTYP